MAYQKSKHVDAAQKYLHQGKITQAVAEYQIVLKHEPKDQVTLMTVGDLFVRQGETFQALEYFERLAQIYLADGFLTKAIAIYKKITKLAPEEMRPLERLADLYVQQGVMSEARPIYLHMADLHQRANRSAQAVGLLRKLLDAEPDNARVQSRLAELLVATHQPAEAVNALRTAAQQLLRRGDQAEALKFADRALKIDPADAAALAVRARVLVAAGKQSEAVQMLQSLPDVEGGSETSSLLIDLYLDGGETARAKELAERVFAREPKRHALVQRVAAALLDRSEADGALALLQRVQSAALEAGEQERLSELLARVVEAMPGRVEPLASLVSVYKHTSDSFRLPDALVHLAEAYEAAGQLELALQTYAEFLERTPENETIRRQHERLRAQVAAAGTATAAAPAVAQPLASNEVTTTPDAPPAPEENLDQDTQLFVSQALTDVDLYSSYGLTQKALELLETVLQRAPDHPPALERLLDLSVGLNDDARAVDLASRLERIYAQCGDREAADRFADLRRRFERAGSTPAPPQVPAPVPQEAAAPTVSVVAAEPAAPLAPLEFEIPVVDAQPEPETPVDDQTDSAVVADSVVHEVDLSEEWAALSPEPAESAPPAHDNVGAYDQLMSGAQDGEPAPPALPAPEQLQEAPLEELTSADTPEGPAETSVVDVAAEPLIEDLLAEYELAMNGGAATPASGEAWNLDSFLRSTSSELNALLSEPASASSDPPAASDQAPEKAPEHRGPLGDVFDEFRADMGEGSDREDPETHYNLGTAYREMGLMEEAISEFQKVASAHQQGRPFRYAMQCYTLLAMAFAEKGQPSIAVSWYERALQVPGLDPETVLALRYDLGVSQEMAGDVEAAHRSFSQVYGTNIDYRDVAERLAALGRTH